MSFLGGLLGSGGTAGKANLDQLATPGQLNQQYGNVQSGIQQQQGLVNALSGQNALGNQTATFNNQSQLTQQLQNAAQGGGPTPAQTQFATNTGNIAAQQAALQAGQRGSGANVGLMGRQAGQLGQNAQMNAAGQAATLQAQQQIAARQELAQNLQAQQQAAAQMAGQQQGAISGLNQASQGAYGQVSQNLGQQNQLAAQQQASVNSSQTGNNQGLFGMLPGMGQAAGQAWSGLNNGLGGIFGSAPDAGGSFGAGIGSGMGAISGSAPAAGSTDAFGTLGTGLGSVAVDAIAHGGQITSHGVIGPKSHAAQHLKMAYGGKVPVALSPGEKVVHPGGRVTEVPGKAKVKGDSLKNDTYRTSLAEGSVVVPRTKAHDPKKMHRFVASVLSRSSK